VNAVDRQLASVEAAIEELREKPDKAVTQDRLQRLYLKRERLQEKSFRLFQTQLAGRK
jgi:hypothetical protein